MGDTEKEIHDALTALHLQPAGRSLACSGRARFMQRADTTQPDRQEHPEHD
jgi:hypothetical protein